MFPGSCAVIGRVTGVPVDRFLWLRIMSCIVVLGAVLYGLTGDPQLLSGCATSPDDFPIKGYHLHM